MKKRKNYGRKIKRNKINLYPRKKTKAQKIAGTVALIVLIVAIIFLGYCLGKPLLEFIEKNMNSDGKNDPAWTPPPETTLSEEIPEDSVTTDATTDSQETAPPAQEINPDIYAVPVPVSALQNSASLSAFVSKAASEGYTAAIVTMKNSKGQLLYATETEPAKDSEAVIGTMKASEICDAITRNGLVPIAEISVLSDNEGGKINGDMCYKIVDEPTVSWLEYFSTGEPLRWSDPSREATAAYNKAFADELKNAGFAKIIATDTVFPPFQEYDREYIAASYFAADRYKLLAGAVIADTCIAVNAEDIILNDMGNTAEVLKNKATVIDNVVIVRISRTAFTAENGYPADAAALLEDVMSQCEVKCMGMELVPMVEKSGFSAEEIISMKTTAEKIGYSDFYIR